MKAPVPPFYITGEEGKAIAAAPVLLDEIGAMEAELELLSFGNDTLRWYQKNPEYGPRLVPENGQVITLFDSTGRRLFTGTAKRRYVHNAGRMSGYHVTVTSHYDWLIRTSVQSLVSDADGVMSMRPLATFPTQDLSVSIEQLWTMARDLGCPIKLVRPPSWFPVTRMTFAKEKFADTLSDMLRWVPDAGGRMLYDVEGPPQLLIVRRAEAERVLIELQAEGNRCEMLDLEADPDMRPTSVSVQSVSRDPVTFKPKFITATAGDPSGPAYKRQLVVASGPENNTLLPTDVYENDVIQTAPAVAWSWVKTVDSQIAAAITNYGDVTLANAIGATYGAQSGSGGTSSYYTDTPPRLYDSNGNLLTGYYRLVTGNIPEWITRDYGIQKVEGFLRGQFGGNLFHTGMGYPDLESFSPTLKALSDEGRFTVLSGYPVGGPYINRVYHGWVTVDVPITLLNMSFLVAETKWRKQDYDFLFPPENLHRDLWQAQNFMPWNGQGRMLPGAPIIPAPGELINALGGDPDWETANAAVKSLKLNLSSGVADFQIGRPAITSATTLQDQFRRAAADNIQPAA